MLPLCHISKKTIWFTLQRLEISTLLHFSIIKHEDIITFLNSAHPMGDDNSCPSFHGLVKSCSDLSLRFLIQSRGGFIKEKDSGFLNESSGNRNPLLLPS